MNAAVMDLIAPLRPIRALADILASAIGHVGTTDEYLLNAVTELEKVGVYDDHLWRLQEMVAKRAEALPKSIDDASAAHCAAGPADTVTCLPGSASSFERQSRDGLLDEMAA